MFNNGSTPNLVAPPPTDRRAVSQPHHHAPLPYRSQNAPWMPPQNQQRAASAQVPNINTSDGLLRKPISHDRRAVSANSSPVDSNGLYTIRSNHSAGYAPPVQPQSPLTQNLAIPGGPSPTSVTSKKDKDKRKSWFGGSGTKLTKAGKDEALKSPAAWILGHGDQRPAYDTTALLGAYKVCRVSEYKQ
jgi:hypothetical protein